MVQTQTASGTDSWPMVFERIRRSARTGLARGLHQLTFTAMNTTCKVHCRCADARQVTQFQTDVVRWVSQFEARYSRFLPDSLISRINAAAGEHWVEIDRETEQLFKLCGEMIFFTRGVFDPTSGPLLKLWNWKATPPVVPTVEQVAAARELVGWNKLERRPGGVFLPRQGMTLDLGGIGKEYAVDRVVTMALQSGIPDVLVDFGADVRVHGEPPERGAWHVGLEDPLHPGQVWTGVAVDNHAVASSGDYLRNFTSDGRRYGHIIDPRDGQPVHNGMLSVSVIAPHCTFAGILSTAAFVLGPQQGLEMMALCPGVEGAIITETSRLTTKGFHKYATS